MPLIAVDSLEHDITHYVGQLERDGYCIISGAAARKSVDHLAEDLRPAFETTPFSKGPFYGKATRRFHGLLHRSPRTAEFVLNPLVHGIAESILRPWCDTIQLNLTQAIEIAPGSESQPPHRDQDMWPIHAAGVEYLINVMWPFSPYTADNGATLIWPGSHRRQDEIFIGREEAITADMEPGDALLFVGSTLHAGGANITNEPRRGMIISYSLGWLKPYELPWLAYPPPIARTFPQAVSRLAGYQAHRPNLGTYEGRCPSVLLDRTGDTPLGAIDMLRPDQEALIAQYRSGALGADPDPFLAERR
ncbi:phytanoyl-CoA dioxygenase [Sphingomonas sp. LH128]|uniref:phytanoyl-CoA dioxygenase family protein n=1 Tax=Sphingomonas sp. LH128 TaxID=473781 RepID=UPI00027CA6BA|nr:phytanoyl-CoA dioxygenase family protein [Sphingomonas sp. LH128]EJU14628.1 phytanoyl-CoA dioxygenase [Sphingomonas sp. LH128]